MFTLIPNMSHATLGMAVDMRKLGAKLREVDARCEHNFSQLDRFMRHMQHSIQKLLSREHAKRSREPAAGTNSSVTRMELQQIREEIAKLSTTMAELSGTLERAVERASSLEHALCCAQLPLEHGLSRADTPRGETPRASPRRSSDASEDSFCLPEISLDHDNNGR